MALGSQPVAQRGPRAFWRRSGFPLFRMWGDISRIAQACNLTPQSVSEWKRVPERHLETVARLLGTTPERLRPDLALRNLMTTDMDPRDAAIAEDTILKAVEAMDTRRVALRERQVAAARSAARLEEARLDHERDQIEVKKARGALTRTRRNFLATGIPAVRLDQPETDGGPVPLPSQGVGGVES